MNIRRAVIEDQSQIMTFLQEVAKRRKDQVLWLPQRWNYAISLVDSLYQDRGYDGIFSKCYLGFEEDQLIAMVHIEDSNNVFIQLETPSRANYEMLLDIAEKEFAITENGQRKLVVWAKASEVLLCEILTERAYEEPEDCSYFNKVDFNAVAEKVVLPEGYRILSLKEGASALDRHNAVHLAFNSDKAPDIQLPKHFIAMQASELYDTSWDFVCYDEANNPCGGFTIWIDQASQTAMIEPVGTLASYRGKGIGKALLTEGLHRLREAGYKDVFVESYGEGRREFYHQIGFRDFNRDYPYSRTL